MLGGCSSVGRAPDLHSGSRRFDSCHLHQKIDMKVSFLGISLCLVGLWFLASAATTDGLLPSGHGTGRVSEIIEGFILLIWGTYRIKKVSDAG